MENQLFADMISKEYTTKEWLMFYRNVWLRNAAARTIDVVCDQKLKAVDPEQLVLDHSTGMSIPVKVRLETRKIAIEDALQVIAAAEKLLAMSDEDLANLWSPEALKVDADMMPKEPKEGDVCDLDDGSGKGVLGMIDGKLVCTVKEATDEKPEETKEETKEEAKEEATPAAADESAAATV